MSGATNESVPRPISINQPTQISPQSGLAQDPRLPVSDPLWGAHLHYRTRGSFLECEMHKLPTVDRFPKVFFAGSFENQLNLEGGNSNQTSQFPSELIDNLTRPKNAPSGFTDS